MVVNTKEFFDGIAILTDDVNMRVTMKQSAKGAAICAATCFVGGLLAGPVGLAIGGTVGGLSAYKMSQGQFKSVSEIIKSDLSACQQEQLLEHIIASVRDVEVTDVAMFLPILLSSASLQKTVVGIVVTFIGKEMNLQLVD